MEQAGFYNPVTKEKVLNKERVQYWLKQGVKPSATLHNFFIKEGILEGKKIPMHKKSKKPVGEAKPVEVKTQEVPKPVEAKKEESTKESKPQEAPKTE